MLLHNGVRRAAYTDVRYALQASEDIEELQNAAVLGGEEAPQGIKRGHHGDTLLISEMMTDRVMNWRARNSVVAYNGDGDREEILPLDEDKSTRLTRKISS